MARGNDGDDAVRVRAIHPLVPAVLALVVTGVLVIVVAGSIGDDDPVAAPVSTTSTTAAPSTTVDIPTTTTAPLPDPVEVEELLAPGLAVTPPSSYRITYDVVENGLARQETWVVRRPYESLVTSTRDGELISGTATSRTSLRTFLADRDAWFTIQPELHRAAFDQRPAAAIGVLDAMGLVELAGTSEIVGRSCRVVVTGPPPSGGALAPPSDDERTELCIDEAGLVLHERWELAGDPVVERTATAIDLDAAVSDDLFDPGPEVDDAEELSAAFQIIAVPADEETLSRLDTTLAPPADHVLDGAVFRAGDPSSGGSTSEIVRFWSSGPDLLEVVEVFDGSTVALGDDDARRIAVDGWDEVWLRADFRTVAVRGRLSETTYVEVRHHDPAVAIEVFRSLDRAEA